MQVKTCPLESELSSGLTLMITIAINNTGTITINRSRKTCHTRVRMVSVAIYRSKDDMPTYQIIGKGNSTAFSTNMDAVDFSWRASLDLLLANFPRLRTGSSNINKMYQGMHVHAVRASSLLTNNH